ncbi:hypothetical protein RvY_08630 [Ramazzottius varieornatus]|uniref:E2F-associated phosphoprotein n=1 Tax=Ramazzottius varieornatus TaxID=947166 RepID=A0A1D1V8T2_RAMVA|nr:hypothetical protein RvY_08630 [Ramazzottius varieornatus]
MFAQDYDLGDEGSDIEPERVHDDDSDSSDDDMKRALRHIGGLDTRNHDLEDEESDLDDFEQSMEMQLQQTITGIESRLQGKHTEPPSYSHSDQKALVDLFKSPVSVLSPTSPSGPSDQKDSAPHSASADPSSTSSATKRSSKKSSLKSVKFAEAKPKFYDDAYFDSDDDGMDEGGSDAQKSKNTEGFPESGAKGKKKPHPVMRNTDLFYDPHMDEEDQAWVDEQRQQRTKASPQSRTGNMNQKKSETKDHKGGGPKNKTRSKKSDEESGTHTDAVLNCPCCMISICDDCQRHEIYKQQYRAMFVLNCYVDMAKTLVYKKSKKPTVKDHGSSSEEQGNLFHPVRCKECQTELGVYDHEEVYHFFNVIASHP